MELNIKSKFNVGDAVTVTRLQETGTVREWRATVTKTAISISYLVAFSDTKMRWSGWVPEIDLEASKPASKFKVGDTVTWDGQYGVVTKTFFDRTYAAVEATTDSGHRHALYESELSPYTPTSPHYFQD